MAEHASAPGQQVKHWNLALHSCGSCMHTHLCSIFLPGEAANAQGQIFWSMASDSPEGPTPAMGNTACSAKLIRLLMWTRKSCLQNAMGWSYLVDRHIVVAGFIRNTCSHRDALSRVAFGEATMDTSAGASWTSCTRTTSLLGRQSCKMEVELCWQQVYAARIAPLELAYEYTPLSQPASSTEHCLVNRLAS